MECRSGTNHVRYVLRRHAAEVGNGTPAKFKHGAFVFCCHCAQPRCEQLEYESGHLHAAYVPNATAVNPDECLGWRQVENLAHVFSGATAANLTSRNGNSTLFKPWSPA